MVERVGVRRLWWCIIRQTQLLKLKDMSHLTPLPRRPRSPRHSVQKVTIGHETTLAVIAEGERKRRLLCIPNLQMSKGRQKPTPPRRTMSEATSCSNAGRHRL